MTLTCPVVHGSPIDTGETRVAIHGESFRRDPHAVYRALRQRYGTLAPVELAPGVPATLVLGYYTAVRILHDPEHFPADPRPWQQSVAGDCPLRPMMEWRPAARYSSGAEHARYRAPSVAAIEGVDLHAMHARVERIATALVDAILPAGRADLASQYAFPLVLAVLTEVFGGSEDIVGQVAAGTKERFDSDGTAAHGMDTLTAALTDLVPFKRAHPGDDITTRLIQHPARLDDREVAAQLMSFAGAGLQAVPDLVCNALRLMLTDDRFGGSLLSGSLHTRDALDAVLFNDPPMANFCTTYPRQPILVDNMWLPAIQPVVISIAACNNDPEIASKDTARSGNRSHLAFSTGPHACPARTVAYQIAQDAIDYLLDLIPDIALAVPADRLEYRPGPFHRALTALPVVFPRVERSGAPTPHRTDPRHIAPTKG
ncbi:cytochrome P450 [Nocardia kruczakiae]|uniref:cytochrome P450 n=1 Tax=Nocardia kruczakiae TaxID=261477 RepID=UPI0035B51FB3